MFRFSCRVAGFLFVLAPHGAAHSEQFEVGLLGGCENLMEMLFFPRERMQRVLVV